MRVSAILRCAQFSGGIYLVSFLQLYSGVLIILSHASASDVAHSLREFILDIRADSFLQHAAAGVQGSALADEGGTRKNMPIISVFIRVIRTLMHQGLQIPRDLGVSQVNARLLLLELVLHGAVGGCLGSAATNGQLLIGYAEFSEFRFFVIFGI